MRCALHASGIVACLAVCAAAGAQTATVTVPPSRNAPEQWQGIANTGEFQAVKTVTDFKNIQDIVLRGVTRIAKDPLAEEVLDKAAKPFSVVGDAFAVYEAGETYKRGEEGKALTMATRVAIDKGVEIFCASQRPLDLACEATYAAATMIGDAANEHWKLNDKINKYAYEPLYDAYQSFVHPELDPKKPEFWELARQKHEDAMAARRLEAHERFDRTSSANQTEQLRINSEFAAQDAPPPSPAQNTDNNEFADFLGTLTNEYAQQQQLQSVPAQSESPSSSPSASGDCHPNHDEQRHPGGCHKDPQ